MVQNEEGGAELAAEVVALCAIRRVQHRAAFTCERCLGLGARNFFLGGDYMGGEALLDHAWSGFCSCWLQVEYLAKKAMLSVARQNRSVRLHRCRSAGCQGG